MARPAPLRALVSASVLAAAVAEERRRSYCIVGAGPGGVQLGQYFMMSNVSELQDYVIFERAPMAGSFFSRYPVHRELISINKRFHSKGHKPEYGFRQDWNSLIGRPDVTGVPGRSNEFFPQASVLLDYLKDFSQNQVDAGRIKFNMTVDKVHKLESGDFDVYIRKTGGHEAEKWSCKNVIMAHGLHVRSRMSNLKTGHDLMLDYNDLPAWDAHKDWYERTFEGKDVAIFGMGNSAMEVAQAILPLTGSVHMYGRSDLIRFSDRTHYPGDIRAGRRQILDHFQLKMGSTFQSGVNDDVYIVKCLGDKRCIFTGSEGEKLEFVAGGRGEEIAMPLLDHLKKLTQQGNLTKKDWSHTKAKQNQDAFDRALKKFKKVKNEYEKKKLSMPVMRSTDTLRISIKALRSNQELMDKFAEARPFLQADDARDPFDIVIRCTGWKHNMSVYHVDNKPQLLKNMKHAALKPTYESVNVPGLYFAGTMAHGLDFRKSAGGFIHGFRYSTRALTRILGVKHGHTWAAETTFSLPMDRRALEEKMFDRVASSSGPYHMFGGTLVDAILFLPNCTARYLEEVPGDYLKQVFGDLPRMQWTFDYGLFPDQFDEEEDEFEHHKAVQFHQKSHLDPFLHPILSFFGPKEQTERYNTHVHADFFTRFASAVGHHEVMSRFISESVKDSYGKAECEATCNVADEGTKSCTIGETGKIIAAAGF